MQYKPISTQGPPERRLAAILVAGIEDRRVPAKDEHRARQRRVSQAMSELRSAIARASGIMLSFGGDGVSGGGSAGAGGLMAEFASVTQALTCALGVQARIARRMARTDEAICFRMAVNAGEVLANRRHVGGSVINLAAQLERIAPPGGIVLPAALYDQLRHTVAVDVRPIGHPDLQDGTDAGAVVSISADACVAWADGTSVRGLAVSRSGGDPRVSLAVVPFRAGGAGGDFAEAATNDVIRAVGGMATWLTVARTHPVPIQAPIDLQRMRRDSGSRYIMHGAFETERDLLRLTIELNEADSGRVLWSDRFDQRPEAESALRQDAASRSARAIPPLLLQRELDRSALEPPERLGAFDLALQAYTLIMQPARATFSVADEMLRQAEQRAAPHASASFARVWWHLMAINQGWSADPVADANAAAVVASRMDRNDPAAMALLGFLHSIVHRDHGLALAMLDQVLDSAPTCGLAMSLKGLILSWLGETQSAIRHAEQAQIMPTLGPECAWRDHVTALACYVADRFDDAARWARVSAMHYPGLAANARVLAASLAVLGRLDEAYQTARQMLAIDPAFRIEAWRRRSMLPEGRRETFARRLRLAGLPG